VSEFRLDHIQLLSDKKTLLLVDRNLDIYLYDINGIEVFDYKQITDPEFIMMTNKNNISLYALP